MARVGGLALPTITEDRALGDAKIQRSLRFNGGDSPKMTRTFGTNTSNTTKTISFWLKRGNLGSSGMQNIFCTALSGYIEGRLRINTDDTLQFEDRDASGGTSDGRRQTSTKLRDTSSWYHIMLVLDSTQGTEADRAKIYINGSQAAISADRTISQNYSFSFMRSSAENYIGEGTNEGSQLDGYLAEINFIDGQALDPSYFGFTDGQTGIWMPKRYEGTYGTNGFYLDFSDNTSTTTLGIDKSPNGNDFTLTNLVIGDSTLDTPSNNFCVLRPYALPVAGSSLSEGNLKFSTGSTGDGGNLNRACMNTMIPSSGKWYMEVHASSGNYAFIGVHPFQIELTQGQQQNRWMGLYNYNGDKYVAKASSSASSSTYASSYGADIIGIFMDMDASTPVVYFSKNGQWANGSGSWNQSNPYTSGGAIELGDSFFTEGNGGHRGFGVLIRSAFSNAGITANVNFGQDSTFAGRTTAGGNKDGHGIGDFKYPVPTNALAICAKNLPLTIEPSVLRPRKHFDTVLYTGNSSTQKITDLEFKPDMIWFKSRTSTNGHGIVDSVRGRSKIFYPDTNQDEDTSSSNRDLASFDDGGFTLGNPENLGSTNNNGLSIVAWCWKAGGATTVSNTDGNQTTQVSVNEEAGFSIVTYTGTGSNTNIGHGLGAVPDMIITKSRSAAGDWAVLDKFNTTAEYGFFLNDNGGYSSYQGGTYWNDTPPTSTVFRVSSNAATNASGVTYMAYCWTSIPGYSKIGKYSGNSSSDGAYVHLGFRPAWVLFKRNDSGGNWFIVDNKRDVHNECTRDLYPNTNGTETNNPNFVDFLSDGFKLRTTGSSVNAGTIVYMAFAEQSGKTPFETVSNAR